MNLSALCGMFFLATLLLAIGIVALALRKNDSQASAEGRLNRSRGGWQSWIGYVCLALVLSLWSVVIGLFFLLVVWLMRKNPRPGSALQVGEEQRRNAGRVYTWLCLSSLITVPFFLLALFYSYSRDTESSRYLVAALAPLLVHIPLLLGLDSKSVFVYRHTQQGILLVALRAGLAAAAVTIRDNPFEGMWLFLLGNGSLWLFGSLWGWIEVSHGKCWLMDRKRDVSISYEGESVPAEIKLQGKLTPEKSMEYSKSYLKHQRKDAAKQYALEAFRHGDFQVRRQALQLLDDLNEVAYF